MHRYLYHVFLNTRGVTAAQNAQKLVVGDEEESGESVSFGVQVVVETLLTPLQTFAQVLQVREAVRGLATLLYHRVFHRVGHNLQ